MHSLKIIHHSVAFLLELIMLAALGEAGYHLASTTVLKYILMIGLPVIVLTLWSVWAAPKSKQRIEFPWLHLFKLLLFTITGGLVYTSGYPVVAIVFCSAAYVNESIAYLFRFDAKMDAVAEA